MRSFTRGCAREWHGEWWSWSAKRRHTGCDLWHSSCCMKHPSASLRDESNFANDRGLIMDTKDHSYAWLLEGYGSCQGKSHMPVKLNRSTGLKLQWDTSNFA